MDFLMFHSFLLLQTWKKCPSCDRSYQAINEVGNKRDGEDISASLGCVYNWRRDFQRAIQYYKRALAVSRKVEGKDLESVSLFNLSVVSEKQGSLLSSLDYYRSERHDLRWAQSWSAVKRRVKYYLPWFPQMCIWYEKLWRLHLRLSQVAATLLVVDQARAQALHDLYR